MIDNREKYYVENIFKRSAIYIVDNYYSSLKWQIKLKFDLINQQKVYGISYASRRFINRYEKNRTFEIIIVIILIILNVIERKILMMSLKKDLIRFGIIQEEVDIGFGRII